MLDMAHFSLTGPLNVAQVAFHIAEVNSTTTTNTSNSTPMGGGPLLLIIVPFAVAFSTFTTYIMIKRIYFPPDEAPNRIGINRRSPSNLLYGNWQLVEKLPADTENVCPICFSSLFSEPSNDTPEAISNQRNPDTSQRLDKVIVNLNPMNAERLIEEQSHSPLGSPKFNSPNTNTNTNATTNTLELNTESNPLSSTQTISLIQSSIQVEGPVVILPCHHCYHETCIKEWCDNHGDCPICRYKPPNPNASSPSNTNSDSTNTTNVPQSTYTTGASYLPPQMAYASPGYYGLYSGV